MLHVGHAAHEPREPGLLVVERELFQDLADAALEALADLLVVVLELGHQARERTLLVVQRELPQDPLPLLDEPNEVAFDLIPTAWTFNAGNRLRLSLRGADADNTASIRETESPTIRIFREPTRPSWMQLPVAH